MFINIRKRGREGKTEGNIDVREKHPLVASSRLPDEGSNQQPRYVP